MLNELLTHSLVDLSLCALQVVFESSNLARVYSYRLNDSIIAKSFMGTVIYKKFVVQYW